MCGQLTRISLLAGRCSLGHSDVPTARACSIGGTFRWKLCRSFPPGSMSLHSWPSIKHGCSGVYSQSRCLSASVEGSSIDLRISLHCRKGIHPVNNWVVGCWHGCLSGARCRLAYGPAEATAILWPTDRPLYNTLIAGGRIFALCECDMWYRLKTSSSVIKRIPTKAY